MRQNPAGPSISRWTWTHGSPYTPPTNHNQVNNILFLKV
jgi:hypothetical protein